VIVGHSSSNILNSGKYKFAFLLLKSLDEGDTFIVHKDSKRYVYKVYKKFVTSPDDTSVLGTTDKPATMTLITCDPPGLSTNRLVIVGEQIFPNPSENKPNPIDEGAVPTPEILPSNSPSLWQRIKDWF
jgi:LPXTG-site transpeptidase (sortase) family protein